MDTPASPPPASSPLATFLGTVCGNTYLVVGSIFFGILSLLTAWIPPRGNVVFLWARIWGRLLLLFSGVRVETSFTTPLPAGQNFIFMANHQSMFDIPVLLSTLPVQTRFMAKQELFKIPIFGWAIRAGGFIPVNRQERSQARDTFREAIRRLHSGVSVLIFPEETRSRDGQLLPFRRGGILLALRSDVPVVPVGISGTRGAQPRGSFRIHPRRVTVRYGAPLEAGALGLDDKRAFSQRVRSEVAQLAGLALEAPPSVPGDGKVES